MDSTDKNYDINNRIAELIEALGMNPNSFSVALGVESAVIYNIVKGRRTKPSFEVLSKILLSFESINSDWLILGKGQMFKEEKTKSKNKGQAHPNAHLNAHLNDPQADYKTKKEQELEREVMVLKAQIEALLRAFREIGSSHNDKSNNNSKSA